jgi:hypothetical protein
MGTRESVHVYSRVDEIGALFISLEKALGKYPRFAAQIRQQDIRDEFDRFRLWAGNIAAHRKGRRSLEYRLRDSALLRDEAHNLLKAVHDTLRNCIGPLHLYTTPVTNLLGEKHWPSLKGPESRGTSYRTQKATQTLKNP